MAPAITLSPEQQNGVGSSTPEADLSLGAGGGARSHRVVRGLRPGQGNSAVMAITPKKISRWRKRFLALAWQDCKKARTAPAASPPSARA